MHGPQRGDQGVDPDLRDDPAVEGPAERRKRLIFGLSELAFTLGLLVWFLATDKPRALRLVLEKGTVGETYNIGGWNEKTNLEVVHMICAILDEFLPNSPYLPHKSLIQYVTDRPGHDRRYAIDASRIREELGWQPQHDFESGLRRTVAWVRENLDAYAGDSYQV